MKFDSKDFETFLKLVEDIELTQNEKNRLKTLSKDGGLMDKMFLKVKNNITNKVLTEDLSNDFIKGAVYTLGYIRGFYK